MSFAVPEAERIGDRCADHRGQQTRGTYVREETWRGG